MSRYANPRSIEVQDTAPPARVSKLFWCRNCRDGRHKSCTGVRREMRNGTKPCECPVCREKEE